MKKYIVLFLSIISNTSCSQESYSNSITEIINIKPVTFSEFSTGEKTAILTVPPLVTALTYACLDSYFYIKNAGYQSSYTPHQVDRPIVATTIFACILGLIAYSCLNSPTLGLWQQNDADLLNLIQTTTSEDDLLKKLDVFFATKPNVPSQAFYALTDIINKFNYARETLRTRKGDHHKLIALIENDIKSIKSVLVIIKKHAKISPQNKSDCTPKTFYTPNTNYVS